MSGNEWDESDYQRQAEVDQVALNAALRRAHFRVAGADAALAHEREQLAQGICPRTGKRIIPYGILRPACAGCDCGEDGAA